MKICSKCKEEKVLSEFNKAKKNKDGHRPECRTCQAIQAKKYSSQPHIKAIKKKYGSQPHRRAIAKEYSSQPHRKAITKEYKRKLYQTEAGKLSRAKWAKKYWKKFPNARTSRSYYFTHKHKIAILDKCQECGDGTLIEAHHCDYNKPMDVIYLCNSCHKAWHKNNTPLNRETGIFTRDKK